MDNAITVPNMMLPIAIAVTVAMEFCMGIAILVLAILLIARNVQAMFIIVRHVLQDMAWMLI